MSLQSFFKPVKDNKKMLNLYGDLIFVENKAGLFFYGGQPISMMNDSLIELVKQREDTKEFLYNVTPKLDGVRLLMLCHPMIGIVFIDRNLTFFEIENYLQPSDISEITLVDGEYYSATNTFFMFDILIFNNIRVVDIIFDERYQMIKNLNVPQFKDLPVNIVYKYYFELEGFTNVNDLYGDVCSIFDQTYGGVAMEYDGLIFTPRFTKYIVGDNWKYPNNILFKWKPSEHQTIDFIIPNEDLIVHILDKNGNVVPWIDKRKNKTYKVSKPSRDSVKDKYDMSTTVFECGWKDDNFVILRDRPDKKGRPNTFKSASSTMDLIIQNVKIDKIVPFITKRITDEKSFIDSFFMKDGELERVLVNCNRVNLVNEDHPFLRRFVNNLNKMSMISRKSLEFEVRIGRLNKEKRFFNTNIQFKHFDWLRKTLDTLLLPKIYTNTVDVFDNEGRRTTYFYYDKGTDNSIHKTITKNTYDKRTFPEIQKMYGYCFRITASSEDPVQHYHVKMENAVNYRRKRRMSYMIDDHFTIDMTEYVDKKKPDVPRFQVEIELKRPQFDIVKFNTVLRFVLYHLYGKSQIL